MYRNLEAEIARIGADKHDLAKSIGRTYNTFLCKMRGEYPFTYDEAVKIQENFFPNTDIKILFTKAA